MRRRVVSVWFPRLPSERLLRARPVDAPFAVTLFDRNSERLFSLNAQAEAAGLQEGMTAANARALCPDLVTRPADPGRDARFLRMLARWATRYCPWVGLDGTEGLFLDITGAAHLLGGEAALGDDLRARLGRAGLSARIGIADTPGAAWALAHFAESIAPPGQALAHLGPLPVAALRLSPALCDSLGRLGIATVAALHALPRATLPRRFGGEVLRRLDQALGAVPEQISPLCEPPRFAVRLTLPEPIGLLPDVMAGTERLLGELCARLEDKGQGARVLQLTLRRVDQASQQVELRLARPMREPGRILPLFRRGIESVEAGFGIDQLRLAAVQTEALQMRQTGASGRIATDDLDDLVTRLGNRLGLDNILRFLPADSHIPERSFLLAPFAYSDPAPDWPGARIRPIRLFPPEPIAGAGRAPPARFRWRRMELVTARATGPERIAPEWWMADEAWHRGLRDYWRVETRQGRRLWLYHTPQNPGWFVQGEFA